MTPTQTISPQPGIVVATAITAGLDGELSHAEGVVVSTALTAGLADRLATNHAEGIAVSTAITAGASTAAPPATARTPTTPRASSCASVALRRP